jgi:hypothetical protein
LRYLEGVNVRKQTNCPTKTGRNKKEKTMENMNEYKKSLGREWIKSESGNTWVCPIGALDGIENPTDEQLSQFCVNESHNPENA